MKLEREFRIMKVFNSLLLLLLFSVSSCTLDKTDYEAEIDTVVPVYGEFKETTVLNNGQYKISIGTLNGTFYRGYNELRIKIFNTQSNSEISNADLTFLPIKVNNEGNHSSCPHLYKLEYNTNEKYYSGYAVFTEESNPINWSLYINAKINDQNYSFNKDVEVKEQNNKNLNMTSFVGKDGQQYYIALISPQKPKVSKNDLVAGIYKYNEPTSPEGTFPDPNQFSYSQVTGYTLALDPRMPEPSMGNHSSPNNVDLTQRSDGLYQGIVNYTMTGNWTLNFILYDQNGLIIKGTEVPTDFTPGVEGVKGELHIDILF
ncbi:MAG: FixH family protein [Flavobacteriaceae bacterium]|jgi:hypothetical protein|nr:FixH family protein [Flavobacteriaceae bacterium]